MIVKELDSFVAADVYAKAGRKAEEQVAFYLKRAFDKNDDLRIFNGLRLENGGDAAQIDHLVLHRYGIIVIESKSVSTRVRINEHSEWSRYVSNEWQGMPSPVLQAKRQGQFLREYLQEHREELRGKYVLGRIQGGFLSMPLDVLVAISDTAIIEREGTSPPEVFKADQIAERVLSIWEERSRAYKKAMNFFNPRIDDDALYSFSKEELPRITYFLNVNHKPLQAGHSDAPSSLPVTLEGVCCAECGRTLTDGVARFCRDKPDLFDGQIYCYQHQQIFRTRNASPARDNQKPARGQ